MTDSLQSRLKRAMEVRSMKQVDVARRGEIDPAYLSLLVNGKRKNPSVDVLTKLAAVLRVRKGWLLTGQGGMEASEDEQALMTQGGGPVSMGIVGGPGLGKRFTLQALLSRFREDPVEYKAGQITEEGRLMQEIMMRLEAASLNADELAREATKRRVDEFFDAIQRNKAKP